MKKFTNAFWRVLVMASCALLVVACSDSEVNGQADPGVPDSDTTISVDLSDNTQSASPQTITLGDTFTLSIGAVSADNTSSSEDNPLFIEILWTIVSKPPNSRATIENPSSTEPKFRPDVAGEYVLKVVISQGGTILAEREVTIIVGIDDIFPLKPDTHIATSDDCMACHLPEDWVIVPVVDHTQVYGACSSCHTLTPNHIVTPEQCDICHSINSWLVRFDHNTVAIEPCVQCHNGTVASGKSVNHISSTDFCEACHFTIVFVPAIFPLDHTQVLGTCMYCHDGPIRSDKPSTHIPTNEDCFVCHQVPPATWQDPVGNSSPPPPNPLPPGPLDHSGFLDTCVTCHNGFNASGKSMRHPPTTDMCEACHGTPPQNWFMFITPLDHNQVLGYCANCHATGIATGKPPNHVLSSDQCEYCHRVPPALWTDVSANQPLPPVQPGPVDHSGFVGSCVLCHDGLTASGKSPNHPNTTDACDVCHLLPPAQWLDVLGYVDHTQVLGVCVSCHDGVKASGKSASHIASTDVCEACHQVWPVLWMPVPSPVDHTEVIGVCSSCHGSHPTWSPPPSHIGITEECGACHSTVTWASPTSPII